MDLNAIVDAVNTPYIAYLTIGIGMGYMYALRTVVNAANEEKTELKDKIKDLETKIDLLNERVIAEIKK